MAATVVAHAAEEEEAVGPVVAVVAPATPAVDNHFLGTLRACKRMVRSDDILAT